MFAVKRFRLTACALLSSGLALSSVTGANFTSQCAGSRSPKYDQIEEKLKEIDRLSGISGLLGWDEMVMLAPGSAEARNQQKAALAAVIHEKQTNPSLGNMLNNFTLPDFLDLPTDYERANIRDAIRDYNFSILKSKEMATKEAELEGRGYQSWASARKEDNYAAFAPILAEIVDLKKSIGIATRPNMSAYDANLDQYERGMSSERLDEIFGQVKAALVPFINKIQASQTFKKYSVPQPLQGSDIWAIDKQKDLCKEFAEAIGFDFDKGRFDISVHPFTGGSHPTDTRITTRYSTKNWLEGVSGTVHEVGHALYEQGRNANYDSTPVSKALSMGVHESQSLFWERMIFQSQEFWEYATPILHKHFPHTASMSSTDLYTYVNQVEPGYIRIEADEVTYPMHIILRYQMEKGLFSGSLNVDSLPDAWWAQIKEMGLPRESNAKGPLQDIHWSIGAFGYFPSYSLGAMIAAQLFETAEKEIPDLRGQIRRGEFKTLREWLRVKIHQVGSLYASPDELLVSVTGKPLDPNIYINYIKNKYSKIYKL